MRFRDRVQAGHLLAERLACYAGRPEVIVLGLPRGGVLVAAQVARELDAPLDVLVVRKLGVPGHEELAMGAIASGGIRVLNDDVIRSLWIDPARFEGVAEAETLELERREKTFRGDRPALDLRGRIVILVDDGVATGCTIRAAARAARQCGPVRLVVAVPVAPPEFAAGVDLPADEIVCLLQPESLRAVGQWYEEFPQTTDEEVRDALAETRATSGARS
ncbi:MAG TPA: phosphoribosyltransferase [Candidatus Polarisedimenticolia bacterium]|nr:phosphoribosyltransferase [Candidatus Polarisedimenticolia bacterium]